MDLEPAEFAKRPLYAYRQAIKFTGIQAILDCTITAKRVHLIDLAIKSGSHWTTFMQVVADRDECPLEHLKISAVGRSKKMMEDVGRRLSAFAAEILVNVSLCFKTVVSDLKNLKTNSFDVEADEVVAFYSDTILWIMLAWPNELESMMEGVAISGGFYIQKIIGSMITYHEEAVPHHGNLKSVEGLICQVPYGGKQN